LSSTGVALRVSKNGGRVGDRAFPAVSLMLILGGLRLGGGAAMSTPETATASWSGDVLADAKAMVLNAQQSAEQLDMLDPVSPEEMMEAREQLGPDAGTFAVLSHAREQKRGRPKGSRNKRTDDFARYC
jgi:hypothetical protein